MSTGLLDTSVVIDLDDRDVALVLPDEAAVCAIPKTSLDSKTSSR
jgi:hypothetical protein